MRQNPFKFIGPLDPAGDSGVCAPREKQVARVVAGILNGQYWSVLGPREIGKTTFLRLLMKELTPHHCTYINFDISPKVDKHFYKWITHRVLDTIPSASPPEDAENWDTFGPELGFLNFLEKFKPKGSKKKIVFFFDDMEKAPCARSFLHLWRKVFHERYHRSELQKYAVVIAGKVELSTLTIGKTSPFNISQKLELGELDDKEAEKLVVEPCRQQEITLAPEAMREVTSQLNGHPQLLQHLCWILMEKQPGDTKTVTLKHVDNAVKELLVENDNLKALEKELRTNRILEDLSRHILDGEDRDYIAYRDYSITGTGPIVQSGKYCAFRNKVYEEIIRKLTGTVREEELYVLSPAEIVEENVNAEYTTTIFLNGSNANGANNAGEAGFLKRLFDMNAVRIQVKQDSTMLTQLKLNRTEFLIFCYLAYENHKAGKTGSSPSNRQHHLSSVPNNNLKQEPEWGVFVDAMNQEGNLSKTSPEPDGTIRAAIFSIRKKLKGIGAERLIPRQKPGGGEGYWLNSNVVFVET